MLMITFTCRGLKKRTNPCHEGREVGKLLGVPVDQQECYCNDFVEKLPRGKGIPQRHTCIRQLGGLGRVFVTQDEPDAMHLELRLKEHPDPDRLYEAIRYLETRHPGTTWRMEGDDTEHPYIPKFGNTKPPVVGSPPPENVEEPTPPVEEPRPRNISPEEIARRAYRGPIAGPPKEA